MSSVLTSPTARILTPGDPGWDDARQAWNLTVDQQSAAVALPGCVQDVMDAIRFARARGLRIAAQGTGHNAAPLGSLAATILVKTTAMRRVSIDPGTKTARAEAGAVWQDVVEAAAEHGLAALAGTSPDVGVIGYTIGGGISWLGRTYGLAANNVEAIEMVTADGRLVRADAAPRPTCFGRCAAAAAASAWSPRSSRGCSPSPKSTPGSCGGPPTRPRRCCKPGASSPRATCRTSSPPLPG
jgi:FAD/FMN-containing dehydrogenase